MTNQAAPQQSPPPRRPGLIARLLLLPLHLFGLLCGALLLALTLQGLGILLFWPEQGWRHADTLAQQELARIQTTFPRSLLNPDQPIPPSAWTTPCNIGCFSAAA